MLFYQTPHSVYIFPSNVHQALDLAAIQSGFGAVVVVVVVTMQSQWNIEFSLICTWKLIASLEFIFKRIKENNARL